jgi:hypothetical protein
MTERRCVKQACKECPFRRASIPGWLGESSGKPMEFIGPHWQADLPLPCHLTVNWESDNSQGRAAEAPLCFGLLTMMKNSAKMPRDPELAAAVRSVERNTDEFFTHLGEFVQHHQKE